MPEVSCEDDEGSCGPIGIDVDDAGNIYAAAAGRILKFDPDGNLALEISSPALERPWGVAVSPGGGCVLVADRDLSRIWKFDARGNATLVFGENGSIKDGKPLPDGAGVEGSTSFSLMVERGSRGIQGIPQVLQDALDRLSKELGRLSDRQWQKELESQLDSWTRQLKKAGEDTRHFFEKEVLPKLEQSVQDLLQRLKELGKEKDGKILQEKLERLKRTLQN